jgi:hypothetical protein
MPSPLFNIWLDAFLDGFSGGGLLVCLRQPGPPTKVFADEGDDYPHKELLQKLLNAQAGQEGHY